jgi:hypothetical protein
VEQLVSVEYCSIFLNLYIQGDHVKNKMEEQKSSRLIEEEVKTIRMKELSRFW